MKITCCKECAARTVEPNCHMTCERYLEQKRICDQLRAEKQQKGIVDGYLHDVSADIRESMRRIHKRANRFMRGK